MPYSVGEKGSYGCSGYPVLKDDDNTVMGCHSTMAEAQNQITAINMSEAEKAKKRIPSGAGEFTPAAPGPSVLDGEVYEEKDTITNEGVGIRNPQAWPGTEIDEEDRKKKVKKMHIEEGDFVMGETVEGIAHGRVEHIMWEGGVLGEPGTEYALESMPPENPAMSVRVYEQEDEGYWVPTAYSIGMMFQDATKLDSLDNHVMPEGMEDQMLDMSKQESYQPTEGMKTAARRALKWKEEGKATGAGTPVGWGRATDIAAGRSMSLSVVKRMYSFFSRHEKASKGAEGFRSGEKGYPSNGRIMWDAWGGDAGFSWSRQIAERNKDKALFGNIFKGPIRNLPNRGYADWFMKAEEPKVGDMVSWNSSGGRARGKITRILRSGSYTPPGTDITITASEEEPAAVIRLYRDGEPTDTMVGHKLKTLRRL
jgi:hypothetical protein